MQQVEKISDLEYATRLLEITPEGLDEEKAVKVKATLSHTLEVLKLEDFDTQSRIRSLNRQIWHIEHPAED